MTHSRFLRQYPILLGITLLAAFTSAPAEQRAQAEQRTQGPSSGALGFQRYVLETHPGVARLRLAACGRSPGEKTVIALDREGHRFRVAFAAGRLWLRRLEGCPQPTPPDDARRLPDGEITRGDGEIAAAWLAEPTRRYDHGILGDAIEAGALRVRTRSGRRLTYRLGSRDVFEDRRVRIIDLEDDGRQELLVLQSGIDSGGRLALFRIHGGALVPLAASQPFGRPYRWLNVAGVADFDGDGHKEIAAVLTPHIGGTLALFQRQGRRLVQEASADGFSNHAIGSRQLDLSAVLDANGDGVADLAVPGNDRRVLRIVTFAGGIFRELAAFPHGDEIAGAIVATHLNDSAPRGSGGEGGGNGGRLDLVYPLADGSLVALIR